MLRGVARPGPRAVPSWAAADSGSRLSQALLGVCLVGLLTLALPQRESIRWGWALAALAAMAATAALSLQPRLGRRMRGLTAPLLVLQIGVLVAATGGPGSPYTALHGALLLYAAIIYGTGRLLVIGAMVAAVTLATYAFSPALYPAARSTGLVVQMGVWALASAVVHLLVRSLHDNARQLHASEQRFRSLFVRNPDAVYALDREGRFTSANAALAELLGRPLEQLLGTSYVPHASAEDREAIAAAFRRALDGEPVSYPATVVHASGRLIPVSVSNLPIRVDGRTVGVFGVARDVSETVALQEALRRQALHDPLTGAANRLLHADRLEMALTDVARSGRPVALLLLDLDDFKSVNDELGHAAGDAVLVAVVQRIAASVRAGDTVSRLGGDEFAVVLPGAGDRAAAAVTARIRRRLAVPVRFQGRELAVSASVGAAVCDRPGTTAEDLQQAADASMYAAKRDRRSRPEDSAPSSAAG